MNNDFAYRCQPFGLSPVTKSIMLLEANKKTCPVKNQSIALLLKSLVAKSIMLLEANISNTVNKNDLDV